MGSGTAAISVAMAWLEPSAGPGSAELQPRCGGLAGQPWLGAN